MADARVRDELLDVGLHGGDPRPVEDADDGEGEHPRSESEGGLGEERQAEAQEAVGAHLQEHPGEDDAARRGRLHVRVGQPRVKRPHGHLDGEGEGEGEEEEALAAPARDHPARDHRQIVGEHAGGRPVLEVEDEDGHEHEERAHQRVEDELDGGVHAVGPAPDPDDEVHRDEHGLPEDIEEKEVEGHEHAQHARLQQEHGDGELFPAPLHGVPRGEEGQGHQEGGEEHEEQADAVHPQVVRDAEGGHPRALLHELIVREGGVESRVERDGEEEGDHARHERRHLDQPFSPPGEEQDDEGPPQGQEGHPGEDRGHGRATRRKATRATAPRSMPRA